MPRDKRKNLARAVAHRAEKWSNARLEMKVEKILSGCSKRTVKALSLPTPRAAKELVEVEHKQHQVVSGVNISAFGRQKIRGKSISLI